MLRPLKPGDRAQRADDTLVVRRAGQRSLDLGRDAYALFGLVFDAITMDGAVRHLWHCARTGRRCFLSTPNLNFAMGALSDAQFRGSVNRSDLSVADGMPVVWVAKWLGLPIRERVAGSDLFERLRRGRLGEDEKPMGVYFFGSMDGVAERASQVLNAEQGPVRCVGFESPGFASVEAMSSEPTLQRINASGAQFVMVAVGAKKGQVWIERNLARLNAPIVSYFGAVINFVAGEVARSPRLLRRLGLEWLWRIVQEPSLWRRYAGDGWSLAKILALRMLPYKIGRGVDLLRRREQTAGQLHTQVSGQVATLLLSGRWTAADLAPLRLEIAQRLQAGLAVQLDLAAATEIDSAFLGLALLLDHWQPATRALVNSPALPRAVLRAIHVFGAESLLQAEPPTASFELAK